MDKEMRRKEKAMSMAETMEVLEKTEYGILSTISTDNTPYGVPMNFAYADGAIYFHCAPVGHRMENIAANGSVCLNVVDSVILMPAQFNTQYRSVTVFGTISAVSDPEEKKKGLIAIVDKLSPDHHAAGMKYIESAFGDATVLKMEITKMTGKATRG